MRRLELADPARVLRVWGGEEERVDLDDGVLGLFWWELGHDCLTVLRTTGSVERRFDILLDEESLEHADTPRRCLALVNSVLGSGTSERFQGASGGYGQALHQA
ncbi:actinorhodin polyketide synthase [Streptomyces sp. NPDC051567]|uniref:actinorhodin polyketide synthase n=1 Tax=Streptomyces sp. NPDC051567 TaxID=3365660 RepID=UPI003799DE82